MNLIENYANDLFFNYLNESDKEKTGTYKFFQFFLVFTGDQTAGVFMHVPEVVGNH